ncbi:hypothetical protein ACIRPK_15510 [Kitasatospora sp. NPDC101801]|uniref:hypothetical protein n=1 Tax=Kitasatospora sp. NPDC101801 TaxID=3364103 RepID=UPI0038050959
MMEPQAAPLWGGGEDVIPAERSYERLTPVQEAAEPLFTPVERSSERLMPVQEAAEPLFSPVEQSAERMMPRQMHTMAAQDPFGTVTEARSSAAGAPDGTFPATRVGGFAPDGTTPAMQVGVPAGEGVTAVPKSGSDRTFPAMQAGVPARDLETAVPKSGSDGTIPATQMDAPSGDGVTSALKVGADKVVPKQAGSASSPSGGAGAGFVAIPDQYRAAAGPVLGVADQLKETYTSLSGYLHGMGANAPWGNDDDGKTFANGEDGEPGYLGNERDILDGLKLLPEIVERIGKILKGLGDSYDSSEDFSLGAIGKPELPTPGTGQPDTVLRDIANGKLNGRH